MGQSLHSILPQGQYKQFLAETSEWISKVYKKSLNNGELTKFEGLRKRLSPSTRFTDELSLELAERDTAAKGLMKAMVQAKMDGKLKLEKAGVTSGLGYNFYDLRGPVFLEYPVNVPFRNSMARVGRQNDGVGVAAHWMATRNVGTQYAGVSEGHRGAQATPDNNQYTATYKEIGVERAATFTSEFASEGFTDVVADEHIRGLHELYLQEEGLDLLGNSGTGTGNNGVQFGTAPTPTTALVATHSTPGTAGASATQDLPYTTINTTSNWISVAVVAISALGAPNNAQYGYGVVHSIANGLTPSYLRNNADGSRDTISGGTSAISALSAPLQCTSGNLTVKVTWTPVKGAFAYAVFVDTETSNTNSLVNAKLAGIVQFPFAYVTGTATGTQAANASGLNTDNSYNTLDYDGLLTYAASTAGATWTDLQGGSLTSQKNGRVTDIETILQFIFDQYQAGVDEIWGHSDAVIALDQAIRYNGTVASGFQFVYNRDSQNNLLGGFVVSGYQSRFKTADANGANVIPIFIHPMIPSGTLFFNVKRNPYPHSRVKNVYEMLVQRDYYSIEWPLVSRQWTFGTYAHQVIRHNFPWISAVLTGIGPFVGS